MKNNLFLFVITGLMLLFFVTPIFGMGQDVDPTNPSSLVAYISPFIVLAVTWVFKKMIPLLNGTWTLVFVAGLSALLTWVTNAYGSPDMTWLGQFALGISSVFLHQLSLQVSNNK